MTLQDWSDYHTAIVSPDAMSAASRALSDQDYWALFRAAKLGSGDYHMPREAIEDAALAMSAAVSIQFLASVYHLDHSQGAQLLLAIRTVRAPDSLG